MKTTALILAALGLASAASAAAAAPQISDMDYLRASRCRGLATALHADASGLDAFVKAEAQGRAPYILYRGDEEFARAKREARGDASARASVELNGPCAAYGAAPATVAHR